VTAALALAWCYMRLSATFPAGADGASNALEAWDMLHGNWLLHGWTLTDVSFYTTELPEYAAVELVRGLNPGVIHAAAGITYALLVLAAAAVARGRSRGGEGWARALIAAGVMLAPQLGNGVHVLLAQPDHTGTQLLILLTFLLVDRAPLLIDRGGRWYLPAAVCALLSVAVVADKIAIVDAVVPLVFGCLLHVIWTRRPGAHLFEVTLAAAAGVSVIAAFLLLALVGRVGGFTLLPVQTRLTTPGAVPGHLALAWHGVLLLFGADVTTAAPGLQTALAWLHAPGIALAVAAFAVTAWHVPAERDLVGDVLAVGIVVNLGGYVASIIPATPFDTREMAALLPFGAVLAGRVFGSRVGGPRPPATARPTRGLPKSWLPEFRLYRVRLYRVRPAAVALAVAGGCQLGALGYGMTRPAAADPELALAQWLAARGLTSGLGTFSEDNLTTLDSGGRVRLLTVSWQAPAPGFAGGAVPRLYQSSASWYDPRTQYANFVVTGTADGTADLIPRADILSLAGPPARTYHFQSFTVLVWNANLLAELGGPPSRIPGDIGRP
jgi:hypothetical protein